VSEGHHFSPRRKSEVLRPILQRALAEHGIARKLPRRIAPQVWETAVGKQMAARVQPTVLVGGTLHLLVEDHRWRDQIDAARRFVLERINLRLGAELVRELQFGLAHAGALDEARRRAGLEREREPEGAVEPERVLGAARLEPGLREAVLRAAEAASRRAAQG
jgi:predicted nucleic acid-binding Zn ribbon protein